MNYIYLGILALTACIQSSNAYPRPLINETYYATESDGTAAYLDPHHPIDGYEDTQEDPAQDILISSRNRTLESKNTVKAEIKTENDLPVSVDLSSLETSNFDTVPLSKVKELSDRLKYTNDILKRFGRAYDYKTITIKQFKKILSDLESNNRNKTVRKRSY